MQAGLPDPAAPNRPGDVRFTLRGLLVATAAVAVLIAPVGWLGSLYAASLVVSSLVMLGASIALWRRSTFAALMMCVGGLLLFAIGLGGMVGLLMVPLHCLAIACAIVMTHPWKHRPKARVSVCLVATLLCYGWWMIDASVKSRKLQELIAKYPIESVEVRLRPVVQRTAPIETPRLQELDDTAYGYSHPWRGRARLLQRLHTDDAQRFAIASGFVVARMPGLLNRPDSHFMAEAAFDDKLPATYQITKVDDSTEALRTVYAGSLGSFASVERSGMVRSVTETAGFAAHAFTRLPADITERESIRTEASEVRIDLRRLELLGYAHHPEPVVYVSDRLPNMETIAETPTRSLNQFESDALAKLVKGEDLIVEPPAGAGEPTQMLGAVRAATSCTVCHEVAPGSLLGAFSYELVLLDD